MKEPEHLTYESYRNSGREFLSSFTEDILNTFDSSAEKQIELLRNKISKLRNSDNNENDTLSICLEEDYIESEIQVFVEMQIINAYRFFEINIKRLLNTLYKKKYYKDLYKWDNLKAFLQLKEICISKLDGYDEVNQLRLVNNNLKHSQEISSDVKKIQEFESSEDFDENLLMRFYDRVKKYPSVLIDNIAQEIKKELFNFDDKKIEKLADELANRIEYDNILVLISKLKQKYEIRKNL